MVLIVYMYMLTVSNEQICLFSLAQLYLVAMRLLSILGAPLGISNTTREAEIANMDYSGNNYIGAYESQT